MKYTKESLMKMKKDELSDIIIKAETYSAKQAKVIRTVREAVK